MVGPKEIQEQRVRVITPPDSSLNLYRIVCLKNDRQPEVLACAARRGGFLAMPLIGDELGSAGKSLTSQNADFVDVTSLKSNEHPLAVAILTLDCSITLVRDLLNDDSTEPSLHYDFQGERAYRILSAHGHVFLLTNRRLYAFVDLVSRFLDGKGIENEVRINSWEMEAVDASLGSDGSLLVVMPHCVLRIEIDYLVVDHAPTNGHWMMTEQRTSSIRPNAVGSEAMTMFEIPPWKQADERQLALAFG